MSFDSDTNNLPPLFSDGPQLPYMDSFKDLGIVCDRRHDMILICMLQLMHCYVHSQLALSASSSLFGSMTLLTGYTSTCGSLRYTQSLLVCMQARFGPPHSYNRNGQPYTKMAADDAQEDYDGQGHNPFMVHHA